MDTEYRHITAADIIAALMGVDRGGRGTRPPEFWKGDANANCPLPDFLILQNFAHQKVESKKVFARSAREIVERTNTVRIVWC